VNILDPRTGRTVTMMNFDAPVVDMAEARDYLARKRLRDKIEADRAEVQRQRAIRKAMQSDPGDETEDGTRDGV
jgi:putative heme iron utilization protein